MRIEQTTTHPPTARTPPRSADIRSHTFVDNIRFWSILSIIAVHCAYAVTESGADTRLLRELLSAPWKFGTICFFLIAGFLLGEGLERRKPTEYMARRLRRVFIPWLIWYAIAVAVLLAEDALHHRVQLAFHLSALRVVVHEAVYCLFDTAYWFIPNMLFALSILLVFRRYFHDKRFVATLIAINLFYAINVYTRWIPSKHTTALLGFILYLWLGNYAARHHARLERWIAQRSTALLVGLTLLTGIIAFGEGRLLNALHAPDPLNGMRLSVQIFSIFAALMLFKIQATTFPRFVNVRTHTFGVYLIHPIVLMILVEWIRVIFDRIPQNASVATNTLRVALWFLSAIFTCLVCFAASKLLADNHRLAWLVGAQPNHSAPPASVATTSSTLIAALPLSNTAPGAGISDLPVG